MADSQHPYNSAWVSEFNRTSGKLHLSGHFGESLFSFGDQQLQSLFLPSGYSNSFLMQVDKQGEMDWVKHMGKKYTSTLRGRLASVEDGVISAFGFNDTAIVEGLPYVTQTEHVLLSKFDLNGDLVWIHQLKSDFVQVAGIVADEDGFVYAIGNFVGRVAAGQDSVQVEGNAALLDAELFMLKLDPHGQVVWLRHIGGGIDYNGAESLAYSDGRLYGCGRFRTEMQLGSTTMVSSSFKNGFLFAMDTSGAIVWSRQFMSENAHPLVVKAESNRIVVGGLFQTPMSIQSQVLSGEAGAGDGFIAAFDLYGNIAGMKAIGGAASEEVDHIEIVSENMMMISGISNSESFDIDGLYFQNAANEPGGYNHNQFAIVIDDEMIARCMYHTTSSNSGLGFETNFNHISTDSVWIVSGFWEELEIDGTTLVAEGGSTFIAKTCMGCSELIRLDIPETTIQSTLHIYPNPASQSIRVEATGGSQQLTAITITDILGHAVLHQQTQSHENTINISGLANGIYALTATLQGGETRRERLVVQH